jgi:hypothetical protein
MGPPTKKKRLTRKMNVFTDWLILYSVLTLNDLQEITNKKSLKCPTASSFQNYDVNVI